MLKHPPAIDDLFKLQCSGAGIAQSHLPCSRMSLAGFIDLPLSPSPARPGPGPDVVRNTKLHGGTKSRNVAGSEGGLRSQVLT